MENIIGKKDKVVRQKRRELERQLSELQKKANEYKADREYWFNLSEEKDIEIDELRDKNKALEATLKSVRARNEELVYTALANAHAIDFLCNKEFDYAEDVEFAAIKYYRKGWGFIYLNGEKINAKDKNVTMYADVGEPINIEVGNA